MDPVDRYLKTVASALPDEQKDDIIRELSEDILSEIEEKEAQVGRLLSESEQQAILKQRGNPLLVASRYRQDRRALVVGRQLIGPVLFPFYVKVLTFNLGLTSAVIGVIFLALQVSGHAVSFRDAISTCLLQLFIQLGAVTLIFSLVERNLAKHPDRWVVADVTGAIKPSRDAKIPTNVSLNTGLSKPISRIESASIIIACAVALVWITEVQSYPFLVLGPAASFLKLAPIWRQMFFPIGLLIVLEILRAIVNLVRPDWTRFRAIYGVLLHIGGLLVVYYLIRAGSWVVPATASADHTADLARAAQIVNRWIYYPLLATAAFSAIMLVVRVVHLARRDSRRRSL